MEADPHRDAADPQEEEALEVAADLQEEKAAAAEAEADLPLVRGKLLALRCVRNSDERKDHQEDRAVPQERPAKAVAEAVPLEEPAALQLGKNTTPFFFFFFKNSTLTYGQISLSSQRRQSS